MRSSLRRSAAKRWWLVIESSEDAAEAVRALVAFVGPGQRDAREVT
jgi:hypothetical protein